MFDLSPLSAYGKSADITFWFKNFLPIGILLLTFLLLYVLPTKSKRAVFVTKLTMACVLSALFLFRFFFWVARIIHITPAHEFTPAYLPRALGLDIPMFLTLWVILTLFVSAFDKKGSRFCKFLQHTLLGVGLTYGVITMFRLDMIDKYDNLYHMLNIGAMINMFAFVFVPLYLVKSKDLKPKFTKFWYAVAGYACMMALVLTLAIVNGSNYSEMLVSTTLKSMGAKIDLPWHLLIVTPAFLLICFGVYMLVLYVGKKLAKDNEEEQFVHKNEFFDLQAFAMKSVCCMQAYFLMIIIAALVYKPGGSLLGFLVLIPFVMTVFSVLAANDMEKISVQNNEKVFEDGSRALTKVKVFAMIGDVLYGLFFLKQLNNEKESIQERKVREEKRRLKMLEKQKQAEQAKEDKKDE